jgi:hypothetical protein
MLDIAIKSWSDYVALPHIISFELFFDTIQQSLLIEMFTYLNVFRESILFKQV